VARIAQELTTRGVKVLVVGDADNGSAGAVADVGGVTVTYSRYSKPARPLRFYWDSLRIARAARSDLAIVCGTPGGALGFLGGRQLAILTNPDGLESRRPKWSPLMRALFLGSERLAVWFSDAIVCDSRAIRDYYRDRHRASRTYVAEYGAEPNRLARADQPASWEDVFPDLVWRGYHLVVARMEPENQLELIARGFAERNGNGMPLVIVSNLRDSAYSRRVMGAACEGVRFLGPIYDQDKLRLLRAGAYAHVHGHTVGGTNPSLVEAMAAGNPLVCHDNAFNRETAHDAGKYFGSAQDLIAAVEELEAAPRQAEELGRRALDRWRVSYTWSLIGDKYLTACVELQRHLGGKP
jgi:glycosyltransferase involved in cell wall biosynthesis